MHESISPATSVVITQRVECALSAAYALAADPARLPDWASGLAKGALRKEGDDAWIATTPQGTARLRFAPANAFGVLDHWVTPEGMDELYMPFRVIDCGNRQCEFQFTLLRHPHMDDAAFARDAGWIEHDLRTLRGLLEGGPT